MFQLCSGTEFAYEASLKQAKALAMTALDIVAKPDSIDEIRNTFQEDLRRENEGA